MKLNLIGQTFGFLTVVEAVRLPERRAWKCLCVCGKHHIAHTGHLRCGGVTNCGCKVLARKQLSTLRHGETRPQGRSKEYRAWAHILGRCNNPTDNGYSEYGARGIKVFAGWSDFQCFLRDMGRAPSPRHSIDRIDNDGDYAPNNCRWATPSEQARNTRRTIRVDGKCLKDICEERSLSYGAVQARIRRGHPVELALSPLTGAAYRAMIQDAPPVPEMSPTNPTAGAS